MRLQINGEPFETQSAQLTEVLKTWGAEPPFAIALNQQFVPKTQYPVTTLQPGDRLDIVRPISGG